jgi:hypothetical protein
MCQLMGTSREFLAGLMLPVLGDHLPICFTSPRALLSDEKKRLRITFGLAPDALCLFYCFTGVVESPYPFEGGRFMRRRKVCGALYYVCGDCTCNWRNAGDKIGVSRAIRPI